MYAIVPFIYFSIRGLSFGFECGEKTVLHLGVSRAICIIYVFYRSTLSCHYRRHSKSCKCLLECTYHSTCLFFGKTRFQIVFPFLKLRFRRAAERCSFFDESHAHSKAAHAQKRSKKWHKRRQIKIGSIQANLRCHSVITCRHLSSINCHRYHSSDDFLFSSFIRSCAHATCLLWAKERKNPNRLIAQLRCMSGFWYAALFVLYNTKLH